MTDRPSQLDPVEHASPAAVEGLSSTLETASPAPALAIRAALHLIDGSQVWSAFDPTELDPAVLTQYDISRTGDDAIGLVILMGPPQDRPIGIL